MTKNYIADLIIAEAKKWIEVREHGYNKGKEVEMFQKAVDGIANGEPWCMAFVQYVAKKIMLQCRPIQSTSKLFSTEHCLTLWGNTDSIYKNKVGGRGMIAIWQKGNSSSGHTGFSQEAGKVYFKTIEGNTNNAGSREGDGVYQKTRLMVNGKMKLKGFIDLPQMIFDMLPPDRKTV